MEILVLPFNIVVRMFDYIFSGYGLACLVLLIGSSMISKIYSTK